MWSGFEVLPPLVKISGRIRVRRGCAPTCSTEASQGVRRWPAQPARRPHHPSQAREELTASGFSQRSGPRASIHRRLAHIGRGRALWQNFELDPLGSLEVLVSLGCVRVASPPAPRA